MEYEDYPNLNFTNIKPSNPKPNGNERRGTLYIVVQSLESHQGIYILTNMRAFREP